MPGPQSSTSSDGHAEPFRPAAPRRRRPRYVFGTFWLVFGVLVIIAASNPAQNWVGFLLGPLFLLYAVYLYRGGRIGFLFF